MKRARAASRARPSALENEMTKTTALEINSARAARDARATLEDALDAAGWPWSRRLSFWLDVLLALEERT